jgi:uncharacterized protein (DUF1697 family)
MKSLPGHQGSYVAFLRGVNVGGHTQVKMEELRKAFESLGFRNVRTVLASGNVLFDAPHVNITVLTGNIAQKLCETFGWEILVIVRSLKDIIELMGRQPFKDIHARPGARMFVTFLSERAEYRIVSDLSAHDGYQILCVVDGAVCSVLYEQPGIGAVHLMGAIEEEFGQKVTTRSWNTIARLLKYQ